jgi:hypothetical protein
MLKKLIILLVLCVLVACAGIYCILAVRANHKAALIRDAATLIGVVNDWKKNGEPQGDQLQKFLAGYGTFKPFLYTNSVQVQGIKFVCLFAIKDQGFDKAGKLAVTRDKIVIWVGENSHVFSTSTETRWGN